MEEMRYVFTDIFSIFSVFSRQNQSKTDPVDNSFQVT